MLTHTGSLRSRSALQRGSVHLGKGWKVRPFIKLAPHETVTLMDVVGCGSIREMFVTTDYHRLSELVLRMY